MWRRLCPKYSAFLLFLLAAAMVSLSLEPAISAFNAQPVAGIYIDAPFVQGTYATGPGVLKENFDTLTDGSSPCPFSSAIGDFSGSAAGGCHVYLNEAFSASSDISTSSNDGTITTFMSGGGLDDAAISVQFATPQKYIGFWWAAGSAGNKVSFYSGSTKVATLNVNQVDSKIGDFPTDYLASTESITSMDGQSYPTKYYFGNPRGYPTLQPTAPTDPAYVPQEKFAYIHTFALNGAAFTSVLFEGKNFEIDNVATSSDDVAISPSLVKIQELIPMEVAFDSNGAGQDPTSVTISFGDEITLPEAPTFSGRIFQGWFDSSSGGTKLGNPEDIYTPSIAGDLVIYAQWQVPPTPTIWLRVTASDSSHDTVTALINPLASSPESPDSNSVTNNLYTLPSDALEIDLWIEDVWNDNFSNYQFEAYMDNFYPSGGASASRYSVATPTPGDSSGLQVNVLPHLNPSNIVDNASLIQGLNHFSLQTFGGSTNYIFVVQLNLPEPDPTPSPSPSSSDSSSPTPSPSPSESSSPSPTPTPTPTPTPEVQLIPGITWQPEDMYVGEKVGPSQLNAKFSVAGSAIYSAAEGDTPEIGDKTVEVVFTPNDRSRYMVLSTSRTFKVLPKIIPSNSPTPTPSSVSTPTITPKPTTVKISQLKKIATIYFNTNEYFLDSKDRQDLLSASRLISRSKATVVYIEGNTDVKKGVDNMQLSRARAESVSNRLHQLIAKPTLNRMWFAASRPASPGINKASLALNRRVDIYIPMVIEKPIEEVSATSSNAISIAFPTISFNRNDYFLDASDRKILKEIAIQASSKKCFKISLVGTRDQSSGAPNLTIASNRITAAKNYLREIFPAFKFVLEKIEISSVREVRISCTN